MAWADNSNNEDGFRVERCQVGKREQCSFAQIIQTAVNATSFSDTGVSGRKTYRYRVRAFNGAGNSAYSNSVEVTTPR